MQGMKLAYRGNCWGALGGNAAGVTAITQLTHRIFPDMQRAIMDTGAVGYRGVELFDGNCLDCQPAALRQILAGSGVKLAKAAFRVHAAGPGRSWHASDHAGPDRDQIPRLDCS